MPRDPRRPLREWVLLTEAAILLGGVHVALRLLPFERVLAWAARRRPGRPLLAIAPDRVVWATAAVARRMLGRDSCLRQALVARVLLARYGQAGDLRMGVGRSAGGFVAHAWLEVGGRTLLRGPVAQRLTPLAAPEGRRP